MEQKASLVGAEMKVVIVHGWTYTLDKWTGLVDILREAGVDVVQLHVPGLTAPSLKVWQIDDYVEWLKKELESVPEPIVIGHSNGGRIALNLVSKYPGVIKKLILIDSAGIYHGDIFSKTKRAGFKVVAKLGKPLAKVPVAKKVFYKLIGAKDYNNAPENMKITMQNMLVADRLLKVGSLKVPTTIIWGEKDKSTPLSDGKKWSKLLNAPLSVIKNAGHSPHATHAYEVSQIILNCIKGSDR